MGRAAASTLVELAALADGIRRDRMSEGEVAACKALLLDSLGCIAGGIGGGPSRAVRRMARAAGGGGATMLGGHGAGSVPLAVMANGTALRYLDFNDYYFGRDPGHPSGCIPALLAIAEAGRLEGWRLLAAIAASYEIHMRLCDAAGAPSLRARGWHHASTLALPVSMVAALLLTADRGIAVQAMAIAALRGGTLGELYNGAISTAKAVAEAWAATSAVEAALLAQAGVTGPEDALHGAAGWVRGVAGDLDLDALFAPSDALRLTQTCLKPYPVVAPATAVVQAAIRIRSMPGFDAGRVASVRLDVPDYVMTHNGDDPAKRLPTNRETADHSYHYCAAVGLLDGACGEAQFAAERIAAPDVRALLPRIAIGPDVGFTARWPRAAGGRVTVTLTDGRSFEQECEHQLGHPSNPMADEDAARKLADLAGPAAAPIRQAVDEIDTCPDVAAFVSRIDAALAATHCKEEEIS